MDAFQAGQAPVLFVLDQEAAAAGVEVDLTCLARGLDAAGRALHWTAASHRPGARPNMQGPEAQALICHRITGEELTSAELRAVRAQLEDRSLPGGIATCWEPQELAGAIHVPMPAGASAAAAQALCSPHLAQWFSR